MTKEEYVKAKIEAGHLIHESDGIWWETTKKGYCNTAILYDEVDPRKSKPAFGKSYIGYSHRIPEGRTATGVWLPFVMGEEGINSWSLEGLQSGNRRRRIKKGLKFNEVKLITDLSEHKEAISRILKSTAIRNGHGNPPEYYDMDKSSWWNTIQKVAKYTEFWCAFQEGELAGYICLHVMGDRVIVDGVKSDTDMLPNCPTDAIIYSMLIDLRSRGGIKEMWYGGKSNRPSLDEFKTSYGFEVKEIPYTTRLLGGYLPLPKFVESFIKRRDDQ
ncbi:MAG: hypothetical protein GC181_03650 [Bacteroidetes bacterium]|nr:hypothetical protein [Bacteroidota bacterium]